jgi:hypothetical protein
MKLPSGISFVLFLVASPRLVSAQQMALRFSSGFSLIDYQPSLGAGWDGEVEGVWRPLPELELGLETALSVPLPTGRETSPSRLVVRTSPFVGLRFGDEQRWSYVRAGFGLDGHVRDDFISTAVVTAAAGFVVAPSSLVVAFGFEVCGKIELLGSLPSRAVGLTGFVEYEF